MVCYLRIRLNTSDPFDRIVFDTSKYSWGREEGNLMHKKYFPEEYGMVNCLLCNGKGFFTKVSNRINEIDRNICTKCGGFGAVKYTENISKNLRYLIDQVELKGDRK